MSDLIRRKDAINKITNQYGTVASMDALWLLTDTIRRVPRVDAVEVVRCGDCKHYFAYPYEYKTCHKYYEIDGASKITSVDFFCAAGERREQK